MAEDKTDGERQSTIIHFQQCDVGDPKYAPSGAPKQLFNCLRNEYPRTKVL